MDSGWFDNLEECFLDTWVGSDLPIWCIEKEIEFKIREIIKEDLTSGDAFKIRDDLILNDKKTRFYIVPRKYDSA